MTELIDYHDGGVEEQVQESLDHMFEVFDELEDKYQEIIDEVDASAAAGLDSRFLGQKNIAIKGIADLHSKRFDALLKSGALENAELAEELAKKDAAIEKIKKILKNDLCSICKPIVAQKIAND